MVLSWFAFLGARVWVRGLGLNVCTGAFARLLEGLMLLQILHSPYPPAVPQSNYIHVGSSLN